MGYGMMRNMYGNGYYGGHFNGWWMLGTGLLNLLVIAAVIFLIYKLFMSTNKQQNNSSTAISILKERYAAGEINEEEYKRKLKVLK